MIVWKNEHLGLTGQSSKRSGMQNAVTVALKTGAIRVGVFGKQSIACTDSPRGVRGKILFCMGVAL
jgi:hypothetical protein